MKLFSEIDAINATYCALALESVATRDVAGKAGNDNRCTPVLATDPVLELLSAYIKQHGFENVLHLLDHINTERAAELAIASAMKTYRREYAQQERQRRLGECFGELP